MIRRPPAQSGSELVAPPPGPHGGDGDRLACALGVEVGDILDLSASLNPLAPDPRPVVARHLDAVSRYPDARAASAALACHLGVDRNCLLLTNGGAEAIALAASERPTGWVVEPEFSLYRRHLASVGAGAPRWRSNPNNPTGRLAAVHDCAEVWDEAFWPLATGTWTRGDAATGSLVLGSLTKLLACPGLRIGYVICPDPETAHRLGAKQPQWSVNGLAAAALPCLLERVDLPGWSAGISSLRADLDALLRRAGFEAEPSDANWLLVRAPGLRDRLAPHGIAVRDCASFGLPGVVRIAVPGPAGLERLEAALR